MRPDNRELSSLISRMGPMEARAIEVGKTLFGRCQ